MTLEEFITDKYDALDKETIIDILNHRDSVNSLLTCITELVIEKYNLGFDDGYECGFYTGCYAVALDPDNKTYMG